MSFSLHDIDLGEIASRARAYAGLFSLPLKDRNWRGTSGDFAGHGVGSSLDFQDHRVYMPGDDPRHINWQAFARTGDYTLKLYREEVRPIVEIVFDVSDSMFADEGKKVRSLELFYFLVAAAERAGASMHICLVKGEHWRVLENAAVFSHRWESFANEMPPTDSSAKPRLSILKMRPRSLRILLSDLLFPDGPEHILQALLRSSGRGEIFCPYSNNEADPGWEGNYDFLDSESGMKHERRVDRGLLKRYDESYRQHFARWKTASIRAQVPLARISSRPSFVESLKSEALSTGALTLS